MFPLKPVLIKNDKAMRSKARLLVGGLVCCSRSVAGETQPPNNLTPLLLSHSVPSLLLHRVLVDYESGPEAAVPARLQRRTEPDREELGHRHSLRQLGVLSLGFQQFQLRRLQLGLRTGAGTCSDMTVRLTKPRTGSGLRQL